MNISEKQLIEASKSLKKWCKLHYNPNGKCNCIFSQDSTICLMKETLPKFLKIPCKWTKEEYELAKILDKGFAHRIEKLEENMRELAKWFAYDSNGNEYSGCLPEGFFTSLKLGEKVYLCDIVMQYEECNNVSNDCVDNKLSDNFNNEKTTKDFERVESLYYNMLKRSTELCEEINWNDLNQLKWYIFFDYYYNRCLSIGKVCSARDFSQIYFDTEEHAKQVLEEFKDELIWYFTKFLKKNS